MKKIGSLLASLLLVAVVAAPAHAKLKKFADAYSSGDYAEAVAAGDARRPAKIVVKVRTDPEQKVKVEWSMKCRKGDKKATSDGTFTEKTPIRRSLYMPLNNPKTCHVRAGGKLTQSGSLYVALFKKRQS